MDSTQLEFAAKNDPFISKYRPEVILESELRVIKPLRIYFILLGGREKKDSNESASTLLGHWVLLETCKTQKIGLYDSFAETGKRSKSLLRKIFKYCKKTKSKLHMNQKIVQLPFSSICGPIVLFVALLISRPGNSYKNIRKVKMNHSLKYIVKVLPDFISYFLPKGHKKTARFSLDFLM